MDSVRPKRLKKRQTGRVGAVEAEFFNGLLEAEYDMLLTQRWVLQPTAEINLHGRTDESRDIGSGLSDASIGLRLRYEISRQFAPYVGVSWSRAYGNSAELQRAEGEDTSEARLVAGIRFWF